MKKLLYFLFAICLMGCGDNKTEEEDCGCVKTTWQSGSSYSTATRSSITSIENVPCQDNNIPYVFVSGNRNTGQSVVWYSICCDNIDDPNSECN